MLHGLSHVLHERVTLANGQVQQGLFAANDVADELCERLLPIDEQLGGLLEQLGAFGREVDDHRPRVAAGSGVG